jgi:hypothetical protein
MAGWQDGRMAGWQDGRMAGCQDGKMVGWQMVQGGGCATAHRVVQVPVMAPTHGIGFDTCGPGPAQRGGGEGSPPPRARCCGAGRPAGGGGGGHGGGEGATLVGLPSHREWVHRGVGAALVGLLPARHCLEDVHGLARQWANEARHAVDGRVVPVGWRGEGVRSNRLDCWMPGTAPPELILKPANQPWEVRKSRAALPGCNSTASRRAVIWIHMLVTMGPRGAARSTAAKARWPAQR